MPLAIPTFINLRHAIAALIFCLPLSGFAQFPIRNNPIIFADITIGAAAGDAGGLAIGAGINYQNNDNLFTVRYNGVARLSTTFDVPFVPIPSFQAKNTLNEFGLLYGKRFVKDGSATSLSLGISYNYFYAMGTGGTPNTNSRYAGVPFEANIKWFNRELKRKRLFGFIPFGSPSPYSNSIGFKLFGNISQQSYVGLGLAFGFGYHKQY